MIIDIITAFPAMLAGPIHESMIKRAVDKGVVRINIHNLRDWSRDRHQTIDDAPYGGGAGMVYKIEPLYNCLNEILGSVPASSTEVILASPRGELLEHATVVKLSLVERMIIICGHYKGVDERIKQFFPLREISIGDYILSGGEPAALVLVDAVTRLLPGTLHDAESAFSDSFEDYLLDCDYYTRPEIFKGAGIPEILRSGDHEKIAAWRHQQKEQITRERRPDLYQKYQKIQKQNR
jgi:tRNA (guanine37-N1)-methyltransferase